jgi:H+/Cl- antiporter ClcA
MIIGQALGPGGVVLNHSKRVAVTVSSTSTAPGGLFSPLIISGIVATLAIISVIVFLSSRRKKKA